MKIRIEIEGGIVSLREYAVRAITKGIVETGLEEKQVWYNAAAIQQELAGASAGKLVKCWLKNVWPLPQLRLLRCQVLHRH